MGDTRLNTGLGLLDRDECLRLLATEQVGRLVMVGDHGRLEIFPVNYVVDGDGVAFRTDMGTKLTATSGTSVAFEVDHLDPTNRSGWSVVIHGIAHKRGGGGAGGAERTVLSSWVISTKPHLVKITPTEMTGRRIETSTG